jgi:hypothetical protein
MKKTESITASKQLELVTELSQTGRESDYTLFNRDWSVVCRGKKVHSFVWHQLDRRDKHADIAFYIGLISDAPVATLRSAKRASRLLYLERATDAGGCCYTLQKDRVQGLRIFWISEGRKTLVSKAECRFVLVIHKNRVVVKARGEAPIRHFSSSRNLLQGVTAPATPSSAIGAGLFENTVVDMSETKREVTFASGMDVVLAMACCILADRFSHFKSFAPDEEIRSGLLQGRVQDFGDHNGADLQDVFASKVSKRGTVAAVSSLLY